jgi:hypothetical protein
MIGKDTALKRNTCANSQKAGIRPPFKQKDIILFPTFARLIKNSYNSTSLTARLMPRNSEEKPSELYFKAGLSTQQIKQKEHD